MFGFIVTVAPTCMRRNKKGTKAESSQFKKVGVPPEGIVILLLRIFNVLGVIGC
jgi:hypothetical protein